MHFKEGRVRFVDISGIVDHHCLNFLFIIAHVLYPFALEIRSFVPMLSFWALCSIIPGIICVKQKYTFVCCFVCLMVFNATFNNISAISWRSVLLMEETGAPGENHRPVASHWQTLSYNVVHLTTIKIRTYNSSGDRN